MQIFQKDNSKLTEVFKWGGILLFSIGAITSILVSAPGVEFTRQYFEFRLEHIIFLVLISTALLSLHGFWGEALSLSCTFSLFFMSLIYKWQASDNFSVLGGLLPLRDANAYYEGAQNIIYGFSLSEPASYRPIFTSFLAVIMKAVDGNLQATLIVLVALNALAAYFATREIQQATKSNFASAVYLILCYMFFRRFSGTLLTENLGFCLGNLALTFLIRGSAQNKLTQVLYGLFLLTIGLNARAGAFFILPTLVLWMGASFRSPHGLWRSFFLGSFVVILGMTANWSLVKLMNSPASKPFSNYAYTLYGIASGNKGWEQAGKDYPAASESEIFDLSLQKIKDDPALFMQGVIGSYSDYFSKPNGAFSFLLLTKYPNRIAHTILWGAFYAGLIFAVLKIKQKPFSICLAFFAGVLLSVSLVPPADSTQMRAYAATIPAFIYVIAAGFSFPINVLRKDNELSKNGWFIGAKAALPLSAAIIIMSFIVPVLIKGIGQPPMSSTSVTCLPAEKKVLFLINQGSSIVVESTAQRETVIPHINISYFAETLPDNQLLAKADAFSLKPGMFITISKMFNIESTQVTSLGTAFLVTNERPAHGKYTICAAALPSNVNFYFTVLPATKTQLANVEIFKTKSIQTSTISFMGMVNLFLIFTLVVFNVIEIHKLPIARYPHALGCAVLLISGISVFMHVSGLAPLSWDQKKINSKDIYHAGQFMYEIDTKSTWMSDTGFWSYPINVYENNIPLQSSHENKSIIKTQGMGSYTIMNGHLFFSTSDNSDPRTNQNIYKIETPKIIRMRYQVIFYLLTLLGLFIHLKYINRHKIIK